MSELHFFDPRSEHSVLERRLPHWTQAGVVCFLTLRTHDSIPREVLQQWRSEREHWLRRHNISPVARDWRQQLQNLPPDARIEFFRHFSKRWHEELDACYGDCVLKAPKLVQIVAESLQKFDGDRYELTDFVIMPNHLHILGVFRDEAAMLVQCENWKHYQAVRINREIQSSGRFWQQDGFDHLVRSAEQFEHFRRYIADNPRKAMILSTDTILWSKPLAAIRS